MPPRDPRTIDSTTTRSDRLRPLRYLLRTPLLLLHAVVSLPIARLLLALPTARLHAGFAVGVFPEGGTGDGRTLRVFHARILQTAVDADVPVQPVALRYGERGDAQSIVAFAPGEPFAHNFLRMLGGPGRVAEVHFLEPLAPVAGGRRGMADLARARIVAALAT